MKYFEKDAPDSRSYYEDREHGIIRREPRKIYKKLLWPINVGIYDIDDKNIKKELCLIVTNIPIYWTKGDITWFFREYFYKLAINESVSFPLIEQVYLIKNEPSAILACHDGISRETIESLSNCMLRSVKDKKKILLTIQPYYKKEDAVQNESEKINKKTEHTEKGANDGENNVEKESHIEEESKTVRKMRKRSLTPPRKNGVEWPSDLDLRNCNDMELRRRLCVFGRYKPLNWGVKELSEFLKHYFETLKEDHDNFEIPEISDMWADKGTHLVTFACKNETSRFNMLLIRACYLNEEDAKINLKNSLRTWLQFEKWTPYRNTINNKFRNNRISRNDFGKYSHIHEHTIDKYNYKKKNFRKPLYDDFSRNKTNSFKTNMSISSNLNHSSNYFYNKEERNKRNYDHSKNTYMKRSPSPHFSKYKKKYSRSPSPRDFYKKKFRKSKSFDSRKEDRNNHWNKDNNKHHNSYFSGSYARK
ncbi:conserved Plasmodium protein, unknown function [Plasmodium ovale]|uniref:Uncharacterized protein n=1 Tax=Plasmodium ovale TaxID=36330 RepID=A0A1D3U995_PLAOA|nr:conserved Plasmodium protein, unknown function [Plasmodium ovale]